MILIPGLLSDQRVWDDVVESLSSEYRLHLINLAGFSGTPAMAKPSLLQVKEDLLSYIKDENLENPIVMGHSVGGFMAMWMALEPENNQESDPENNISAIISIDGLPFYGPTITFDAQTQASDLEQQAQQISAYYGTLNNEQMMQNSRQTMYIQTLKTENIEKIMAMINGSDGATVGQAMATLLRTDLRTDLNRLSQPLLLLGAGGAAFGTSIESQMIEIYNQQLETSPQSQLIFNWQSGHFMTLDEPAWVLEQVQEFLGEL